LQKQKKKSFAFLVSDILSVDERVMMKLFLTYGNDMNPDLEPIPPPFVRQDDAKKKKK
jgi:hypothetical protein